MKLTDTDRLSLYKLALAGLIARPGPFPDEAPPNREGIAKKVNKPFALACWAQSIVRASEAVLDEQGNGQSGSGTGQY